MRVCFSKTGYWDRRFTADADVFPADGVLRPQVYEGDVYTPQEVPEDEPMLSRWCAGQKRAVPRALTQKVHVVPLARVRAGRQARQS
jgi:hypothetical protein